MMLSPMLVNQLIHRLLLVMGDEQHGKQFIDALQHHIKPQDINKGHFDSFAFAWGVLPPWGQAMLLSVAYREHKQSFNNITLSTPIHFFNDEQRQVLSLAYTKLLTAVVSLLAHHQFSDDYFQGLLSAHRDKNLHTLKTTTEEKL